MPRRSSHYRDCDEDKHRRKCDRCKSCYKYKKSSHLGSSDSSLSSYSTNSSCKCAKCSKEIKNEKPKIVFCNKFFEKRKKYRDPEYRFRHFKEFSDEI